MVADLWTKVLPHSVRDKGMAPVLTNLVYSCTDSVLQSLLLTIYLGIAFIDHTLPVNSVTGRYGFYADWEDEKDNEFDEDLNEDTSEDGSLSPFAMDSDLPPDQSMMNHSVGIENTSVECSSGTQEIEDSQIQKEEPNVIRKEEGFSTYCRVSLNLFILYLYATALFPLLLSNFVHYLYVIFPCIIMVMCFCI